MTTEKTIGILIARFTSSRLPGKALRMVNGRPLLSYPLERLKAVNGLDEIWLATTQHPSDEQLMLWGIQEGIQVYGFPGEMDDVVGRVTAVLNKTQAQRFVMVLGDTPFPDTRLMQNMLGALDEHPEWEWVGIEPGDTPSVHSGIACFRATGWQKVDQASTEAKYREHAGSVLQSQPGLIRQGFLGEDPLYFAGPYRLTVDTQADLELTETIAQALQKPGEIFSMADVIHYLQAHPELIKVNGHVHQKTLEDGRLQVLMAIQAGGDYGTGHLARCKTLARTLEEHYAAGVTFWFDGPSSRIARELAEEGCNVVEGNWSLPEAVRQGKYSRVVIDFQTLVPPSLIHGIRMCDPELPIIVMDNNGLGAVDADAVIFPNAHAKINPELRESPERLYEGPLYVVLGAGFLHDPTDWQEEAPIDRATVLISMGGRDPELLTEKVLDSLKDLRDAHIDLVVPPLYPYPENLEKIATRLPSTVTLHWRIRNLRPLMKRTTIAVAAFGVTAYELAYMHVPTILLGHYESQVEDMERFCKLGTAVSAGWGVSLEPDSLYRMVTTLIEDEEARKAMAERGAALIDDKGPLRVAEAIVATTHIPVSVVRTEGL